LLRSSPAIGAIVLIVYSPMVWSACLSGLGPGWADIAAEESDPVSVVAAILKERGELRSDEIERWYRDKAGRVVYCRYKEEEWNSFLFELVDGKWIQINSVRTVL
jgi:hypothetical protein